MAGNFLHKIQMLTLNTRELYGKPMGDGEFNEAIAPQLPSKTLSSP
nr:hypothetical protein [Nostoc sp. EkiNYC01]